MHLRRNKLLFILLDTFSQWNVSKKDLCWQASQCRVDINSTSSPRMFWIYCIRNFSSLLTHTISYVEKYCIHIIGLVCKALCGLHFLISPDYYEMINRSYLKLAFTIKPLVLELNVQGTLQMTEDLNGDPSFWMVWVCDFI